MHRLRLHIAFVLLLGLTAFSCQSPLDIDTPRTGGVQNGFQPANKIFTLDKETDFEDWHHTEVWDYAPDAFHVRLDTTQGAIRLWSDLYLLAAQDVQQRPDTSTPGLADSTIRILEVRLRLNATPVPATLVVNEENSGSGGLLGDAPNSLVVVYQKTDNGDTQTLYYEPPTAIQFSHVRHKLTPLQEIRGSFSVELPRGLNGKITTLRGELSIFF